MTIFHIRYEPRCESWNIGNAREYYDNLGEVNMFIGEKNLQGKGSDYYWIFLDRDLVARAFSDGSARILRAIIGDMSVVIRQNTYRIPKQEKEYEE